MRPLDPETNAAFTGTAPSLCTCMRIVRRDGREVGITDHDQEVFFGGTRFASGDGATLSALEAGADLAVDNAEIIGILSAAAVSAEDLDNGRFDGATVEVWQVDWSDPDRRILLRTGTLGAVTRAGGGYTAEFRSLKHLLGQVTGRIYGRNCDAQFGDVRCGIDAGALSADGTLDSVGTDSLAITGLGALDHPLEGGRAEALDGPCAGLVRTIRTARLEDGTARLSLWEDFPTGLAPGTTMRLTPGCDKRLSTCRATYANVLNFRGFPSMPGNDVLLAPAARRQEDSE